MFKAFSITKIVYLRNVIETASAGESICIILGNKLLKYEANHEISSRKRTSYRRIVVRIEVRNHAFIGCGYTIARNSLPCCRPVRFPAYARMKLIKLFEHIYKIICIVIRSYDFDTYFYMSASSQIQLER